MFSLRVLGVKAFAAEKKNSFQNQESKQDAWKKKPKQTHQKATSNLDKIEGVKYGVSQEKR